MKNAMAILLLIAGLISSGYVVIKIEQTKINKI